MGANTAIEWTDHTFNPWIGCTQISPACDHCYARTWAERFARVAWNGPPSRTSHAAWNQPFKWNEAAKRDGVRRRVFCASLADVFDNQAAPEWRAGLWELIAHCDALDWLLLTKRPQNIVAMRPVKAAGWGHVWHGTTVENRAQLALRLPILRATAAAKRFLSIEPLLEDLGEINLSGIDWVIVGGESGPNARPMHPEWARSLRDQCNEAGVPFFFKQWGEWTPGENVDATSGTVATAKWFGDKWSIGRENLAHEGGHRDDEPDLYRIGKRAAGRLLDGREWNEVPT